MRAGSVLLATVWFASMMQIQVGSADSIPVNSANLTVFRTCVLSGTIGTSTSVIDAGVNQASAGTNYGTATTMLVQSASLANQRAYLKFDLTRCSPAIPSTATVSNATLRLYVTIPAATVCRTQNVYPVTSSWAQSTITWTLQPTVSGTRTAFVTVGTGACNFTAAGYVGWTVTTDVASWVAGTKTNFGWLIRDATEGATTTRTNTYGTSDAALVPQAPQLVVNYAT